MTIILTFIWQLGEALKAVIQTLLGILIYPFAKLGSLLLNSALNDEFVSPQFSTVTMLVFFFLALGAVFFLIRYSFRFLVGFMILSLFNSYVLGTATMIALLLLFISYLKKILCRYKNLSRT